jgi:NAD(P)H-dependent FMN reductase
MINKRKRVLAIAGSTRSNSINQSILKSIAQLYNESLETEFYEQLAMLPHFNPDLDKHEVNSYVAHFRTRI